jgi:hypothetical protein
MCQMVKLQFLGLEAHPQTFLLQPSNALSVICNAVLPVIPGLKQLLGLAAL